MKGTITIQFETDFNLDHNIKTNCRNVAQYAITNALTDNFIKFSINEESFIKVTEDNQ